jgi:alpha-L-fucosidase
VQDFEKQQRAPKWIYPYAWQVDDAIGSTWGYTDSPKPMGVRPAASIVTELIELCSQGGNLLLNISPMGDGSIPEAQQKSLLGVGEWLKSHGEGVYDSRPWRVMGEGPGVLNACPPDWKGGSTAEQENAIKDAPGTPRARAPITEASFRFTTVGGKLYAFGYKFPAGVATIKSLSTSAAKVERVTLLGPIPRKVDFKQTADALVVTLPATEPFAGMPYGLRIEGSQNLGIA